MKKMSIMFFLAFILLNCTKNENLTPDNQAGISKNYTNVSVSVWEAMNTSSEQVSQRSLNEDEFYKQLYVLARAFRNKIASNPSLMNEIINQARTNEGNLNIIKLAYQNPLVKTLLNEGLVTSYQERGISAPTSGTYFDDVLGKLNHQNVKYSPNIYIPNYNSTNLSNQAIVAVGTDIDVESLGITLNDGVGDYIAGWNVNGGTILITEDMAMSEQVAPIVIINNDMEVDEKGEYLQPKHEGNITPIDPLPQTESSGRSGYTLNFKIHNLYDRSGRAEYYIRSVREGLRATQISHHKVREIKKRELGQNINHRTQLNYGEETNTSELTRNQYNMSYEFDWFASLKRVPFYDSTLPPIDAFGNTNFCLIRATFEKEWYQLCYVPFDPNAVQAFYSTYKEGHVTIGR